MHAGFARDLGLESYMYKFTRTVYKSLLKNAREMV